MDSARKLLLHSSHADLLQLGWQVEAALEKNPSATMAPADAYAVGVSLFNNIAELLRDAWGAEDLATFTEVERGWSSIFSADEIWLPGFPGHENEYAHSESTGLPPSEKTVALMRWREVLRLGLIMWGVWRLGKREAPLDGTSPQEAALQQLASYFPSVDYVFDAYEAASDFDWKDRTPFTGWFLSELPTGVGHFIPTLNELLRTSLLLAVRLTGPEEPTELAPREWFVSRREDIERALRELAEQGPRWAAALGASAQAEPELAPIDPVEVWGTKLARLGRLLASGEGAQEEREKAHVRAQPIDPARVATVREKTLTTAAGAGVLRALLRHQGARVNLDRQPDDVEALVSRNWAPKSFFIADSRVVGVDLVGRDLGRSTARAEIAQFVAALPSVQPPAEVVEDAAVEPPTDGQLLADAQQAVRRMREADFSPSLIVTPISWRLQHALGLGNFRQVRLDHPAVPVSHAEKFNGLIGNVPVMDMVQLPSDQLWILDLRRAMSMIEWPSENDSGVRFELLSFDEPQAQAFVETHPEVRGSQSVEESVLDLQEKVLMNLFLCWLIRPGDPQAATSLTIPPALRRE